MPESIHNTLKYSTHIIHAEYLCSSAPGGPLPLRLILSTYWNSSLYRAQTGTCKAKPCKRETLQHGYQNTFIFPSESEPAASHINSIHPIMRRLWRVFGGDLECIDCGGVLGCMCRLDQGATNVKSKTLHDCAMQDCRRLAFSVRLRTHHHVDPHPSPPT